MSSDHIERTTAGVVVPVLNARRYWPAFAPALLENIQAAQIPPERVLIIDSSSNDGTAELAAGCGFRVHRIPKSEFDHGGTRQLGVELLSECGLIVFLTQDVILAEPESISRLLSAFDDPNVGVAYGRQLPRKGAGAIESHARFFNYPQQSHTRNFESRKVFGFKSTFCSDAFGAYRREALESVGGFIVGTIFGEDLLTTAKLHLKGWSSAYVGDARVYHSHGYSFAQEFTRYFDIGVGHARESSMLSQWGSLGGEGLRFVRSETRYLMAHEPLSIPSAYLRTFLKYSAYHLGKKEKWLPVGLKRRMSMNRGFWK